MFGCPAGRDQRYEECGDAYINTGCDDDEGVEYYEYEGLHGVDFEKRVTLFCVDGDDWKVSTDLFLCPCAVFISVCFSLCKDQLYVHG